MCFTKKKNDGDEIIIIIIIIIILKTLPGNRRHERGLSNQL